MKAILLNSGGIDSRVTAAILRSQGYTLHSLHIHLNKKNDVKTLEAASRTARLYCQDHFIFEYPTDWNIKKGIFYGIPFTFLVTHSIGAPYAYIKGGDLASGYKSSKKNPEEVHSLLQQLLDKSLYTSSVKFITPLLNKSFSEVQELAKNYNVPLEDTYSCTQYPPCGKCASCSLRRKVGL